MQFNIYTALFFFAFFVSVVLSVIIYKRKSGVRGGGYFFHLIIALGLWALGAGFQYASASLETKITWQIIIYLFVPFIPFAFLSFILRFVQASPFAIKVSNFITLSFPLIIFIIAATNNYHHLMWSEFTIITSAEGSNIDFSRGIFYYLLAVVSYIAILTSFWKLLTSIGHYTGVFKNQLIILLIALLIPTIVNLTFIITPTLLNHFNATPIAFVFSCVIIAFGIFKYSFLDLFPTARQVLFENLHEGVIVLDSEGRIIDCNKTLYKFIGQRELIGKQATEAFSDLPELVAYCNSSGAELGELQFNGKVFQLNKLMSKDPKANKRGKLISLLDITTIRENQALLQANSDELNELNNAKDKLFSIIAHDLKNPFFGIIGLSDILLEDFDDLSDSEKRNLISEIKGSAADTFKLLENLLEWSRLQTGKVAFNPEDFNINEVINKVAEIVKSQAGLKRITIETELALNLSVYADPNMITTVIRNLLTNAIKFTNPGGKIVLSSEIADNFAIVTVEDNGVGLTKEESDKLFRSGESIRSLGTMGEKGTGLGLMICQDFVTRNNGTIHVRPNMGDGATFWFTLPLSKKQKQTAEILS